jgi:hypothetical protein
MVAVGRPIPALNNGNVWEAVWRAVLFGALAYGTYDLTNLATIRGWASASSPGRYGQGLASVVVCLPPVVLQCVQAQVTAPLLRVRLLTATESSA